MSTHNILIRGEIGVDYTYNDALLDYQKAKDADEIVLLIDSPGGYLEEGSQIADLFAGFGNKLRAINVGDVMSVAVDIFLAAPVRQYRPERGRILIHYPWLEIPAANADELAALEKEMRSEENKLVAKMAKILNVDEAVLRGYMQQERALTPEEVESLGIAQVIEQPVQALAYIGTNKNKDNMNNEEVKEKLTGIEKMLAKLFPAKPKALVKQDANGVEIDMPEIETEEQIAVGVTATIDGNPAEGEYQIPGLGTVIFTDGAIAEIIPVDEGGADGEEMEALKQENADLKQQLTELSASMKSRETEVSEMRANAVKVSEELKAFKSKFSDDKTPPADPPAGGEESKKKSFKYNGRKK